MRKSNILGVLWACGFAALFSGGCSSMAASAEEYFSIGMAYFDLGKYDEAEKWLNRAKLADKTQTASEYNLGRIAFETRRYTEAAGYFEDILKHDPQNVLALKAAAYTRIKTGNFEMAERHYNNLLVLVPESADDGYNYALVLYAMERYADAEKILASHQYALQDNAETLLLYARSQKAQGKVEAADSYAKWLTAGTDPKVRYEYAQILESQELYARALEEYRLALSGLSPSAAGPKRSDLRFAIARLLLVADSGSAEGITELRGAVSEGFDDAGEMEKLLGDGKISAANRESIKGIIAEQERAAAASEADGNAAAGSSGK